jgi:hypothetical protein
VLLVERLAGEAARGMVGTVGTIEAWPNMINIVPGEVDLLVDLPGDRAGLDRQHPGAIRNGSGGGRCAPRGRRRVYAAHAGDPPHGGGRDGRGGRGGGERNRRPLAAAHERGEPRRESRGEVKHLATGALVLLELLLRLDRDIA